MFTQSDSGEWDEIDARALRGLFVCLTGTRDGDSETWAKLGKVYRKKRHPCLPDVTSAWQLAFVIIRRDCN